MAPGHPGPRLLRLRKRGRVHPSLTLPTPLPRALPTTPSVLLLLAPRVAHTRLTYGIAASLGSSSMAPPPRAAAPAAPADAQAAALPPAAAVAAAATHDHYS